MTKLKAKTTTGPELSAAELKLLITKPDETQREYEEGMSRPELRRLERARQKGDDDMAKWGGKLTTRADVANILGMYIERNLLPMAFRLDELEQEVWFLSQPFWKRWYLAFANWWHKQKEGQEDGE
tara:strand:- start:212 stop:589 length:378 start_codon:yes stop_codon:yes gene_type:complete